MHILLVSATLSEISPLMKRLTPLKQLSENCFQYQSKTHTIDMLITGVGMVFTSFHVGRQLSLHQYDFALNAGIAGAIDFNIKKCDIVHVIQDYFYELGAEDGDSWLSVADLGLLNDHDRPYYADGLLNDYQTYFNGINQLKRVKGHTVNKVHGETTSINLMRERSNAQVESMEGAAFLYVCMKMQIPCAQVRAISNYVEPRNKANWDIQNAIQALNQFLFDCIGELG